MRPSTLPLPVFNPPDKLDSFLDALRWDAYSTPDVKSIRSCFRFGIENEDKSLRLFVSEETLVVLPMVAREAAQAEKFVIQTNMWVPAASVIHLLFEDDWERDAASREDLGDWSDSKGKRLEGRAIVVEARKFPDRPEESKCRGTDVRGICKHAICGKPDS